MVAMRQLALPDFSPQQKRCQRLERQRWLTSMGNPADAYALGGMPKVIDV